MNEGNKNMNHPPKRILIVDDDMLNLRLMVRMLDKTGIEVDQASSGAAALSMAMKSHYDMIFLDISMPAIGGVTVARSLRQQLGDRAPRIIACTAQRHFGEGDSEGEAVHFDDVLTKPFVRPDLLRLVGVETPDRRRA